MCRTFDEENEVLTRLVSSKVWGLFDLLGRDDKALGLDGFPLLFLHHY